jgi:ABC-type transport system involved in multi-copper enzyme maturation permease subunit
MIGPVLNLELTLGSRRGRHYLFRWIYAAWLLLEALFLLFLYAVSKKTFFLDWFVAVFLVQHFVVILLATPAYTAGAVTDEKGRGTLQYLLTAGLTSWEIVAGKLVGRTAQVGVLLLTGLPLLCFVGVFGGIGAAMLLSLVAVSVLTLFAVAGMSLLASVWSLQTRGAVLSLYALGAIVYPILLAVGGVFDYLDPFYVLEPAWGAPDLPELGKRLLGGTLAWGGLGAGCLAVAAWRMRPAYFRQLEGEGKKKKLRWWRARRGVLRDDPIRWRERNVEGIAPFAFLRAIPWWLGVPAVFLITTLLAFGSLLLNLPPDVEPSDVARMVRQLDHAGLLDAFRNLRDPRDQFLLLALVVLAVATFVVGVRCSGAVSGERERQTWEALLLTPLETRTLIRGKLWGIMGATYPYLLAYAVPAVFFALIGSYGSLSFWSLFMTGTLLGVTWLGMFFVGAAGIWCSVRSKSSWRSLLGTLGFTYVGGFLLLCVLFFPIIIIALIVWGLLAFALTLLDKLLGTQMGGAVASMSAFPYCFIVTTCVILAGLAFGLAWWFVADAEKRVADRERTRHWRDAGYLPRSRRRPVAGARYYR